MRQSFPARRRPARAAGRARLRPSARAGGSAGPGLAALRILAALADLGRNLSGQLVIPPPSLRACLSRWYSSKLMTTAAGAP